jgi:hypothetical protein
VGPVMRAVFAVMFILILWALVAVVAMAKGAL